MIDNFWFWAFVAYAGIDYVHMWIRDKLIAELKAENRRLRMDLLERR